MYLKAISINMPWTFQVDTCKKQKLQAQTWREKNILTLCRAGPHCGSLLKQRPAHPHSNSKGHLVLYKLAKACWRLSAFWKRAHRNLKVQVALGWQHRYCVKDHPVLSSIPALHMEAGSAGSQQLHHSLLLIHYYYSIYRYCHWWPLQQVWVSSWG